ncbi:MAG TPA: hypothetical protein VHD90_04205 [Phototrophicaceae bacterium]|nr:hypothetical protein [Phototrophicaceae bacterium]
MSQDFGQQIISQFDSVRSRFDSLYSQAQLSDVSNAVNNLTRDIGSLPTDIASVRSRGYAFASYLEHKAEVLAQNWNSLRANVESSLSMEISRLTSEVNQLRYRIDAAEALRGNPNALQGQLPALEDAVQRLESLRSSAQSRLENIYSTLQNDTAQTHDQLQQIKWYLDQRDEAKFPFLQGEALFLAAKAEWELGREHPNGILYLTDQRLLFEEKETVGKTLGLFGGKKVQELKLNLPLNQVQKVDPENKGFLGGKDILHFTLAAGAPYAQITVEVKGGVKSKFWAAQIQRMIEGKTSDERAIQPDKETIEALQKAPTACPSCGGTLPQLVAGQRQTECPYCGAVVRI